MTSETFTESVVEQAAHVWSVALGYFPSLGRAQMLAFQFLRSSWRGAVGRAL